jgi:predicted nucleotidyltransferase component of viral defense system
MNVELVNKIKRITIIALASDDELMETIVLKGGNAIDLVYRKSSGTLSRASFDLDFSVENEFFQDEQAISQRIQKTLEKTFLEYDYVVIDYKFQNRPKKANEVVADFWGGYLVTFKVLERAQYEQVKGNVDDERRRAIPLKKDSSPTFEIEFSKFEYVEKKEEARVDGYTIYVYTAEMIVFEKLRAICQQLPDYKTIIASHTPRARARDFYDIHLIMTEHGIHPNTDENKELMAHIFEAKRVPLSFIQQIRHHKYIHSDDWNDVKDTVSSVEQLEDFDFYFNYVLEKFEPLTFP